MKLKKSFYNIEKEVNDKLLLLNTMSRSYVELNNEYKKVYNLDYNDNDIEKINQLKERGFLVDENLDEFEYLEMERGRNKYDSSVFSLTITPTLACNMNCPYCFEHKTDKNMGQEMQNAVIEFAKEHIKNCKHFFVTWYGGEPLLCLPIIKNLSEAFIGLCKENNITYNANIITNGTLLTPTVAKALREEYQVTSAQITLDGMGETNNKRRKLINHEKSFDLIIKNIDECKDIIKIAVRINVDKTNTNETEELINLIENEKNWKNSIRYYFAAVEPDYNDGCYSSSLCYTHNEFSEVVKSLLQKAHKNSSVKNMLNSIICCHSVYCSAETTNSFVVDANGYIYKCWSYVGNVDKSIGHINAFDTRNQKLVDWVFIDYPEECKSCKLLPICGAGCVDARLKNNNSKTCEYDVLALDKILELLYEEFNEQNNN